MAGPSNSRKAFTLIEMLVVITIIAILAAVLVAKYGQIREDGWSTRCKANLRCLYQAALNFSNDPQNEGAYPYAGPYEIYDSLYAKWYERQGWVNWIPNNPGDPGVWPNGSSQAAKMQQPTWPGESARLSIRAGSLWEYSNHSLGIYFCPKFRSLQSEKYGGKSVQSDVARSYVMNSYFGSNDGHAPDLVLWDGITIKSLKMEASRTLMFADMCDRQNYIGANHPQLCTSAWAGNSVQGNDCVLDAVDAPMASPFASFESIGYHHRMAGEYRGHVVFLDGHIDAVGMRVHWQMPDSTVVFRDQSATTDMDGWTKMNDGAWSNRTFSACQGLY